HGASSKFQMRIEKLTLRELHMELVTPFQTSMETTTARRILLTEAVVDGITGWGECVAGETPSYSPETTDTAWHVLRDHLWPLLKGTQFACAAVIWTCWVPFAATIWQQVRSKLPSGRRRHGRKTFRWRSSGVGFGTRFPVESR